MRLKRDFLILAILCVSLSLSTFSYAQTRPVPSEPYNASIWQARMPKYITPPGENEVIVDPRLHAWGAYSADGNLIRGGLATAGANWCGDIHRACRTSVGVHRILSLGSANCKSSKFPVGRGGAPMPYCMYFKGGQALHGSHPAEVVDADASHGCVRMKVQDAEWLRFNFIHLGTKVVILSY